MGKQIGLDDFAPGWKEAIARDTRASTQRNAVLNHWRELIAGEGKTTAGGVQHFKGKKNQPFTG